MKLKFVILKLTAFAMLATASGVYATDAEETQSLRGSFLGKDGKGGGNSGANNKWCKTIPDKTACNWNPHCKWGGGCKPNEDEIDSADFDFDQSSPDEEDYDSDLDEAVTFSEA